MKLTTAELASILGGRLLRKGRLVTGASTDTRILRPGDAFFALLPREEQGRDGHAYVAEAVRKGAGAVVVSRTVRDIPDRVGIVEVEDTLIALGRLGAYWRKRMPARVAAVTGSVGKTSTKAMLGAILSPLAPTIVAERSYNNEIGVPLTVLQLNGTHRFCVLEFAMRGPGEIAYLAALARPELAIITNIGHSHIGRLGSTEAIAAAKAEVLPLLPKSGTAVLNRDDRFFDFLREQTKARVISFGWTAKAEVTAESLEERGLEGTSFICRIGKARVRVSLRVAGRHFVQNALAAAAAASALGADSIAIARGLAQYEGTEMRGRVIRTRHGFTIIADCYNAAPDSVEAALRLLSTTTGRRVFVFGDMAELGDLGPYAHRKIGEQVVEYQVALLVTVGELAALAGEVAKARGVETLSAANATEALTLLVQRLAPGDTVLVKGSRIMHLEDVVEGLTGDA
ncbi:MAG: UDP-N-acetylmuramoyl-tripeptide--D-alanyl-D-alanine ligase [Candidatus Zipacnadales bacterium]